jgi:hypothetical protein
MPRHHIAYALDSRTVHRIAIFVLVILFWSALALPRAAIAQPADFRNLVPKIGVTLVELDENNRARYNIPSNIYVGAVIAAVVPNTDAAAKGLKPGDVITEAWQLPISHPQDIPPLFGLLLSQQRTSVTLQIISVSNPRSRSVEVSFLDKIQSEATSQYLNSPAAQDVRPQVLTLQSPAPQVISRRPPKMTAHQRAPFNPQNRQVMRLPRMILPKVLLTK